MKLFSFLPLVIAFISTNALAEKTIYIIVSEESYSNNNFTKVMAINVDKSHISGKNVMATFKTQKNTFSATFKSCNKSGCSLDLEITSNDSSETRTTATSTLYDYGNHNNFFQAQYKTDSHGLTSGLVLMSVKKYKRYLNYINAQRNMYGYAPSSLPNYVSYINLSEYPDEVKKYQLYYNQVEIQGGYIDPKDF